jgi:hypothetical protein
LGDGLNAWQECYDFYVSSKRSGVLVSEPPPAAKSEPAPAGDEPAAPMNPVELAEAIVGVYSEPKQAVSTPAKAHTVELTPSIQVPAEDIVPDEPQPAPTRPATASEYLADEPTAPARRADPTRSMSTMPPSRTHEYEVERAGGRSRFVWISVVALASLVFLGVVLLASREPSKPPAAAPAPQAAAAQPAPTQTSTAATESTAPAGDAASEAATESATPTGDGSELPRHQGWLIVESIAGGSVYSNGVLAGPTNQPLKVSCGGRFLRVGSDVPGQWLSDGLSARIACQSVTRLAIKAKAP